MHATTVDGGTITIEDGLITVGASTQATRVFDAIPDVLAGGPIAQVPPHPQDDPDLDSDLAAVAVVLEASRRTEVPLRSLEYDPGPTGEGIDN